MLDFVQRAHAVSLLEAARLLGAGELPMIQTTEPSAPYNKENRRDEAISIWRSAVAAPGTRAETYLRERAISMDIPASIRFTQLLYGNSGLHPVMIGLVASVDNCALGIQRTYLNPTGTGKAPVPKPKLSLGAIRGGAVRLGPAAATLVVTEGIEDALSLQQELGLSAWAGVSTSGLVAMRLPQIVREVVIGADADNAGERAAAEAAERFSREGRSVRIIRPSAPHKDFNAELMAGGTA